MTIRDAAAGTPPFDDTPRAYDAVIVVSFGGPEGPEEVMPFLENVARGRNIPRARLEEVAKHYLHYGGVSPINAQNRALIAALEQELQSAGHDLPVYLGNRNWHPFIADTLRQMRDDGVTRAAAFVTSAFSCFSGCRQYREDLQRAQQEVEGAPALDKLRIFYNHPGFLAANVDHLRGALAAFPESRRDDVHVAFTAHSIPLAQARHSTYVQQLVEAGRLVAEEASVTRWQVVYQSRSGPPHVPWLEPDVLHHLEMLARRGLTDVVIHPLGFVSDHMEVLFDLDEEAKEKAETLGMTMVRAPSAGTHAAFVAMIRELLEERMRGGTERTAAGAYPANHDLCPVGCCLAGNPGDARGAHHRAGDQRG